MKILMKLAGLVVIVSLVGCSSVGLLSKSEQFNGTDSFEIESPKNDILEIIAAVGEDMGMSVAALNKNSKSVTLNSSSSTAAMLVGSINRSSLGVMVMNDGKTLNIGYSTYGNWGSGGRTASTKLVEEFKSKLAIKLGQKVASKGQAN